MEPKERIVVNNADFFAQVKEELDAGHRVTIPVKGVSMLPFIRGERDLVTLEKPSSLGRGDIVLFTVGRKYVMHRILRIDGDVFVIMGDGVLRAKERTTRNRIVAKVVEILRDGERSVDPSSPSQRFLSSVWRLLFPFRVFLLKIYRNLPWNRKWLKPQLSEMSGGKTDNRIFL